MRKYTAMGLTAVLVAASFPAAVLADETDVKSVRIGAPYDPVTMDYAELNVDPATYIDTLISDTLIRSKQGEYIGGAADSWETSEDGKTWTFKLKEGLTYSDGKTPITSEDFVYAAKRLIDPEAGHYNAENGYILENGEEYYAGECEWDEVGIKAVDDLTIEYTFKNPQYEYNTLRCGLYPFKQQLVTGLLEFLNLVKLQCLLPAVRFMRSFFHMPFFAVNRDKDNCMITFLDNIGLQKRTISETDKEEKYKEVLWADYSAADVFLAEERKRNLNF